MGGIATSWRGGMYTYVQVVLHMGLLKTNEFSPCLALGSNELKIEHGL